MGPTSAIVLYVVIWFLTLLIIAPVRLRTQGDMGHIVEGTHSGAPEVHHLKAKIWITTGVAAVLWGIAATIILSGWITMRDIDFFNRMGPPSSISQ